MHCVFHNETCETVSCWLMPVCSIHRIFSASNILSPIHAHHSFHRHTQSARFICTHYVCGWLGLSYVWNSDIRCKIINKVSVCCTGTERFVCISAEHQSSQKCWHEQMRFVVRSNFILLCILNAHKKKQHKLSTILCCEWWFFTRYSIVQLNISLLCSYICNFFLPKFDLFEKKH